MTRTTYIAQLGLGFLCYVFWCSWTDWYWYSSTRFGGWLLSWAGFWAYRLPWSDWRAAVAEGGKK